ncbi:DUF262 domain-containing protein [Salmonirosea aquatica]|uniref:DUF262 domain-containing protein n=1 Tax=Salmonirosea aquatica TaxID=2654236 RepID=A0A7C9FTA9_9BACT|nr:DUF262 domain-containing protein [Cytophagaceae bacterium SJW1-29]
MLQVKQIENLYTIERWYFLRDRIDFDPTYQRKTDIWRLQMKQLFINTILNNYDFPKIYLADFSGGSNSLNENKKQYAVIDGKQRLSTIFGFMENQFVLDATPIYYEDQIIDAKNFDFDKLLNTYPFLVKRFENYIPTVMGVQSDRPEDIFEMFIRLNINLSISGAERRNALPGPVPIVIRKIAIHPFLQESARFVINNKNYNDRGQDLNAAAKILSIELSGGKAVSIKKQDLDAVVNRNIKTDESYFDLFVERANANLNKLNLVFEKNDPLLKSPTQFSAYYLFIKEFFAPENIELLHSFLIAFEKERSYVKKVLRSRGVGQTMFNDEILKEDFLSYNTFIRSPDDKVSIEGMVTLLTKYFEIFKQRGTLQFDV